MPDADVYQGERLVAHIERTDQGTAVQFLPDVQLNNGFLSIWLPGDTARTESADLHPFFLNLFPEGARLRLLLEASQSKDDALALLLKVGWDAIGDVSVFPHGAATTDRSAIAIQSNLKDVSFWELFMRGMGKDPDSSVPGVQEKISASTIAFGVRMAKVPSAILKLNPRSYPRLVQNEEFFLRMAKSCGLETNRAVLVYDREGEAGLLVTRFDRVKEGRTIRKLHQEDACQLLNIVPANKYSTTINRIAEAVSKMASAPTVEIERLLRLYAFSYIIGNGDLHAKNISLIWDQAVRLSPAYDLLSTLPYPLDRRMALKIDGRDDNFRASYFVAFGKRFGVPERATRAMIDRLCTRAEPWIGKLDEIGFDSKQTEKLKIEITDRIAKIRR